MDPLHQFIEAYQALYETPDASARQSAHAWLLQFQSSPQSWTIVDQCLHNPALSQGIHFLALTILHTKLRYNYSDLNDSASRLSLRMSLINHVQRFSHHSNHALLVRLSLCLATLAIQSMSLNEWPAAINEMIAMFQSQAQSHSQPMTQSKSLLAILKELPEEAYDNKLHISDQSRSTVIDTLQTSLSLVIELLWSVLSHSGNDRDLQRLVFECLNSWIDKLNVDIVAFVGHPLCKSCFDALMIGNDEIDRACGDCIVTIIERASHTDARHTLIKMIVPLRQIYESALATHQKDRQMLATRLLTTMGERDCHTIIEAPHDVNNQSLLDSVLLTCNNPDRDIAGFSFPFWIQLNYEVVRMHQQWELNQSESHSQSGAPLQPFDDSPFVPYYLTLLERIRSLLLLPGNWEKLNMEERESVKRYRYLAADTLRDTMDVIGTDGMLMHLWEQTVAASTSYISSARQHWQQFEAALHCFRAIGGRVPYTESVIIPPLMELIFSANFIGTEPTPQPLCYTVLLLVSRYSDWIANQSNTSYLTRALSMIVTALNRQPLQAPAATAFHNLCQANARLLVNEQHRSEMLPSLLSVFNASVSLHLEDQREIVSGICAIISVIEPQSLQGAVSALIEPTVKLLSDAYHSNNVHGIDVSVDRLSHIYAELRPSENDRPDIFTAVLSEATQSLWPSLSLLIQRYSDDERKMEKVCRILKHAFKHCKALLKSLYSGVMETLTREFHRRPQSAFLYLIGICCDTFVGTSEDLQLLHQCFQSLTQRMLTLFPTAQSMTESPDLVEDYFDLCYRIVVNCPILLVESPQCLPIVTVAIHGLSLQHGNAMVRSTTFLSLLFNDIHDTSRVQRANSQFAQYNHSVGKTMLGSVVESVAMAIVRGVCHEQPQSRFSVLAELTVAIECSIASTNNRTHDFWLQRFEFLRAEHRQLLLTSHGIDWVTPSLDIQNDFVRVVVQQSGLWASLPPLQAGHCQRQVRDAMVKLSSACRIKGKEKDEGYD